MKLVPFDVLTFWEFRNMIFGIELSSFWELFKFIIEIVVLVIIIREIRELRKHQQALYEHENQLKAVRPLLSTLYTSREEIMDLAVSFTKEAKVIYAVGLISSLKDTERKNGESQQDFNERLSKVHEKTKNFINATREHILNGKKYFRIMDLRPNAKSPESILDVVANINYFLRLIEFSGTDLQLYHNTEVYRSHGDLHFRCSDKKVVIRAGGHENDYSDTAIVITDTRVVNEFCQYYQSLIDSNMTICLEREHLHHLQKLLDNESHENIEDYLNSLNNNKQHNS